MRLFRATHIRHLLRQQYGKTIFFLFAPQMRNKSQLGCDFYGADFGWFPWTVKGRRGDFAKKTNVLWQQNEGPFLTLLGVNFGFPTVLSAFFCLFCPFPSFAALFESNFGFANVFCAFWGKFCYFRLYFIFPDCFQLIMKLFLPVSVHFGMDFILPTVLNAFEANLALKSSSQRFLGRTLAWGPFKYFA